MLSPSRLYWTARTAVHLAAEHRIPYLASERLDALCDRRARSIVAHAYATVPFYREAMHDLGLRPADIRSAADLALLPLISGRDLAAEPRRFFSTAVAGQSLLELMTSGSSGYAKHIAWDKNAVFRARAAGLRHRRVVARFVGRDRPIRKVIMDRDGGTRQKICAFHARHSWIPSGVDAKPVQIRLDETFEQTVRTINAHEPDVLSGFGGYIGAVYRWACERGLRIARPKVICYGGENLPEPDRRLLESHFRIPVITSYQACEALRIAFQCEKARGLHVSVDQTHVRIADAEGATLPPGTRGRVVISNLINRATVLLNYDIGDLGVIGETPCPCGRTLPMLESIDGREEDFITLPHGEIAHESVVLSALYSVPGIWRVQIIQETACLRVRVMCSRGYDWNATRNALARVLPGALGTDDLTVEWERVESIDPEPSGKFKSIISNTARG